MSESLLSPFQQRVVICVLAALLLVVSMIGLWLCKRLGRAYERLYVRQKEETDVLLAHPDHRQVRAQPRVPPQLGPPAAETADERARRTGRPV